MTSKTIRLSDLQLVLLSHGAKCAETNLLPLPHTARQDEERIAKELKVLLRRKLIAEVEVKELARCWRKEDDRLIGLNLTGAALEALGIAAHEAGTGPAMAATWPTEMAADVRPTSKIASVFTMLQREQGATLIEMTEATGWLPHTTRAALTGLKKKGHTIERSKRGKTTCYRATVSA